MGSNKNKTNRSADPHSTSGNSSSDTNSDGVIVHTPTSSQGDPSSVPPLSTASLLRSFDALSLEEQFDLLSELSIMQKLEGKMPFSEQEQQEIKMKRLDTDAFDPSKFNPDISFLHQPLDPDATNDGNPVDRKPVSLPSSFDGTGFRPTSVTFLPKGGVDHCSCRTSTINNCCPPPVRQCRRITTCTPSRSINIPSTFALVNSS